MLPIFLLRWATAEGAKDLVLSRRPSPDFSYRLDELKGNGVGYTSR